MWGGEKDSVLGCGRDKKVSGDVQHFGLIWTKVKLRLVMSGKSTPHP